MCTADRGILNEIFKLKCKSLLLNQNYGFAHVESCYHLLAFDYIYFHRFCKIDFPQNESSKNETWSAKRIRLAAVVWNFPLRLRATWSTKVHRKLACMWELSAFVLDDCFVLTLSNCDWGNDLHDGIVSLTVLWSWVLFQDCQDKEGETASKKRRGCFSGERFFFAKVVRGC